MLEINDCNGANIITALYAEKCMEIFNEPLIGCEMGIAYGGGPETIGKMWKGRGTIYGFDTFEGHPQDEIIDKCRMTQLDGGKNSVAARCMDNWYSQYGVDKLSIKYQQSQLDAQGLDNVKLVKGLIDSNTDISFIEKLHYCFLDLDYYKSMKDAHNLIKSKIVKGGFLLLHDVIPKGQISGLYDLYCDIMTSQEYRIVVEAPTSCIAVLQKIKESKSNNLVWL